MYKPEDGMWDGLIVSYSSLSVFDFLLAITITIILDLTLTCQLSLYSPLDFSRASIISPSASPLQYQQLESEYQRLLAPSYSLQAPI